MSWTCPGHASEAPKGRRAAWPLPRTRLRQQSPWGGAPAIEKEEAEEPTYGDELSVSFVAQRLSAMWKEEAEEPTEAQEEPLPEPRP